MIYLAYRDYFPQVTLTPGIQKLETQEIFIQHCDYYSCLANSYPDRMMAFGLKFKAEDDQALMACLCERTCQDLSPKLILDSILYLMMLNDRPVV